MRLEQLSAEAFTLNLTWTCFRFQRCLDEIFSMFITNCSKIFWLELQVRIKNVNLKWHVHFHFLEVLQHSVHQVFVVFEFRIPKDIVYINFYWQPSLSLWVSQVLFEIVTWPGGHYAADLPGSESEYATKDSHSSFSRGLLSRKFGSS